MSEEINKIIDSLEGCIGMFDYLLTPIESNLLVSYIKELQQENQKYKKVIDKAIYKLESLRDFIRNESDYIVGASEIIVNITTIINIIKEVK